MAVYEKQVSSLDSGIGTNKGPVEAIRLFVKEMAALALIIRADSWTVLS